MLHKVKNRKQTGFTIIEVLIVLAIAGLILLIVFLAVPALQRNARNTTAKDEGAQLASAATEFTNNAGGTLPVAADNASILALTKNKTITTLTVQTANTAAHPAPALGTAVLDTGVKCGASGGASTTPTTAATRSMVLIYSIENSAGAPIAQCIET
jgi:prepilin-type N-terminal cleavage/methylation domain-containing protein